MKPTVLAAAALAAALAAPDAHADCARPQIAFLPATGAVLPPQPTIYAFIPTLYEGDGEVTVHGDVTVYGDVTEVERIATGPAFEVLRIRVRAGAIGEELSVRWRPRGAEPHESNPQARYRIGEVPPNRARVAGVSHEKSEWACSSTDALRFEFDGTALAYSIAWDDGTTDVIPADLTAMLAYRDPPGSVTWTDLGKPDCMRPTTDLDALARKRSFQLSALFADGSQLRLGTATAQLGADGVRLPVELVGASVEVYERAAPSDSFSARPLCHLPALLLGGLGGAAACLGAGLLYALLRALGRKPRDHSPRH